MVAKNLDNLWTQQFQKNYLCEVSQLGKTVVDEKNTYIRIELWKQFQQMQSSSEERLYSIYSLSLFISVISAAALFFSNINITRYLFIAFPMLALIGLFYAAYSLKINALVRGYLAALEKAINNDLEQAQPQSVFAMGSGTVNRL